jgi:hypothetical protein
MRYVGVGLRASPSEVAWNSPLACSRVVRRVPGTYPAVEPLAGHDCPS